MAYQPDFRFPSPFWLCFFFLSTSGWLRLPSFVSGSESGDGFGVGFGAPQTYQNVGGRSASWPETELLNQTKTSNGTGNGTGRYITGGVGSSAFRDNDDDECGRCATWEQAFNSQFELWKGVVPWTVGFGIPIAGLLLALAGSYENARFLSNLIMFFAVCDIGLGSFFAFISWIGGLASGWGTRHITVGKNLWLWGSLAQALSGGWRIAACTTRSKLALWLWLVPFLGSLLSAVSFLVGLPSLALVAVLEWRFKMDWGAGAANTATAGAGFWGFGGGNYNQVAPVSGLSSGGQVVLLQVSPGATPAPATVVGTEGEKKETEV